MQENTTFEDIFNSFKSKVIDYDFLNLTSEQEQVYLTQKLRSALAKFVNAKDVVADFDLEEFTRALTPLEIDIISSWMVAEWGDTQVYNVEKFKNKLSSRDYQTFSEANSLKVILEVRDKAKAEAHYWSNRYSVLNVIKDGVR